MIVYCVRIGNKYGPEYESYIENRLEGYDIRWIREPLDGIHLQWNKMIPMGLEIDEPVCVIDIDLFLINEYREVFEYPIERGEFLAMPGWWRGEEDYKINGGFFKYYPIDCKKIYDKFMRDPSYWMQYYIKNGTTTGPVNGEQYFVEDSVKEIGLNLKLLPDSWVTRWATEKTINQHWDDYEAWCNKMNLSYIQRTGNQYCFLHGEFHEDIKIVHFTNTINKPHQWDYYDEYI